MKALVGFLGILPILINTGIVLLLAYAFIKPEWFFTALKQPWAEALLLTCFAILFTIFSKGSKS